MRLFTSILLVLLYSLPRAQNSLHLYSRNGEVFQAFIGDSLINQTPQASLSMHGLKKDTLLLKIKIGEVSSAPRKLYLLYKGRPSKGLEHRYLVERRNQQIVLSYQGTVKHVAAPEPLVPPKPVIDTSGKYNNNLLGHYCELKNGKPFFLNNVPADGLCREPMPAAYMNYMKLLMSRTELEDLRLQIADETTKNNCISVSQLNLMLSYLSYEIEKLKLVKASYARITDKANSPRLDSTFKLEASVNELRSFLKSAAQSKSTLVSCPSPAKDAEMEQLFNRVASGSSDDEKMNLMTKYLPGYCLSLSQIRQLVNLFAHDDKRLDAAKTLFPQCAEKPSYEKIGEAFAQKQTRDQLLDFLRRQY